MEDSRSDPKRFIYFFNSSPQVHDLEMQFVGSPPAENSTNFYVEDGFLRPKILLIALEGYKILLQTFSVGG